MEDLRRRVGEIGDRKGSDVTPEQRPAYPTSEDDEVAEEALGLPRNGDADVGIKAAEGVAAARGRLGEEIYDVVWNPPDLADLAGVDLEGAFEKEAGRNEGREW